MTWENIEFKKIQLDDIIRFITLATNSKTKLISQPAIAKNYEYIPEVLNTKVDDTSVEYLTVEEVFTCDPYVWVYKEGLFQYQKWYPNE